MASYMAWNQDFFKTQMHWTLKSGTNFANLLKAPPAAATLTIPEQNRRRQEFERTMNDIAEKMVMDFRNENTKNYTFLRRVNVVMILIGIALLGTAMIIGLIRDDPNFAAIVGGLAIADFVATFIINPQSRITGLLKDFAQFELIFVTWSMHVKLAFEVLIRSSWTDIDIQKFQDALEKYTSSAITDIETNIGKE